MNLDAIHDFLGERIGLDAASLGPSALPQAVQARMKALHLTDPIKYLSRLEDSLAELGALHELLAVRETWFFRGGGVFEHLAKLVAAHRAAEPFRVLSVPCSTGEEPYSLALTLDDAGIGPERWDILGVDLSGQAIEHARDARYGGLAFRELSVEQRTRWFQAVGNAWRLHSDALRSVRFQTGNLLDPAFLRAEPPFDVILCRNLLIYLNTAARGKALAALDRLLAPSGTLCLGHAEPWRLVHERFQRVGDEGCFLFERRRERRDERRRDITVQPQAPPMPARAAVKTMTATVITPPPAQPIPSGGMAEARRLADRGDLNGALERCQQMLKQESPSADALALTGVVHIARHEENEALICLRKALYLEPDHREALEHLLVLSAQLGDQAQARLLRQRLERVRAGGQP